MKLTSRVWNAVRSFFTAGTRCESPAPWETLADEQLQIRTCHLCKLDEPQFRLTQYSRNRWVHWDCGVAVWGSGFLERLLEQQAAGGLGEGDPPRQWQVAINRAVSARQQPRTTRIVNGEIVGPNDHHFHIDPKYKGTGEL